MEKKDYHQPLEYVIGSVAESTGIVFDVFKTALSGEEKSALKMLAKSGVRRTVRRILLKT